MKIFPEAEFTKSEMHEIFTHLANPAVKKYLHSLAYNAAKDIILAQRKLDESAESFLFRINAVKGGIGVVETLLSIEAPTAVSVV